MLYVVHIPNPEYRASLPAPRWGWGPRGAPENPYALLPKTIALNIAEQKPGCPYVFFPYKEREIRSVKGWEEFLRLSPKAVIEVGPVTMMISAFFERARENKKSIPKSGLAKRRHDSYHPNVFYEYDPEGFMFHKPSAEK